MYQEHFLHVLYLVYISMYIRANKKLTYTSMQTKKQWMDKYENDAKFNIAETCSASISIDQLEQFSSSPSNTKTNIINHARKLTYGAIPGSQALRTNIAKRYACLNDDGVNTLPAENIVVTPGGIAANFICLYTLVEKGDHVICVYPTYQQLYEVPKSLGAEVELWRLTEEKGYIPDIDDLRNMVKENTKIIIIKYVVFYSRTLQFV